MSGHSKWNSIKHKKAAVDAKRGQLFTRVIKELTVAARHGGGNPDNNPRLRLAIQKAKEANMPADNIDRAIKKGTGELPGVSYEEVHYEGYGPSGAAIYIHSLTDNKNRTAADIRSIFAKNGGNMAGAGSVAWLFELKGLIALDAAGVSEDALLEIVLNAGAEDMRKEGDTFEVITQPPQFESVKQALDKAKIKYSSAEVTMIPKNTVQVTSHAKELLNIMEALEEHEDVQNVYSNFDIPEETMNHIIQGY